jgi:hypothetical protein
MATPPVVPTSVKDPAGRQYSMGRKLGKGGFAICHQAQVGTESIALKVVRTVSMAQKVQDKFLTELQIHSKVRHNHIVGFHRAFTVEDNTYIALELCTQGSLKEMITTRGRISMPEIRRFGLQLCGALHFLHSRSVVHRDIKSANILLDEQMNIKLGDFGLAAVLVTDEELGEVKRRATVCGTPNYIAPEILRKKQGHNTKADIWSLGVLFFNMMTGQMPFSKPEDKDNQVVFKRVVDGSFQWPEYSSKILSNEARDLVSTLLQPVDENRPEALVVAQHDFFRLGGIPAKMDTLCTKESPVWLKKAHPRDIRATAPRILHEDMLKQCGLVETDEVIAKKIPLTSLLMEEVTRNLVPHLPLPNIYERMDNVTEQALKSKPRRLKVGSTTSRKPSAPVEHCNIIGPQGGQFLNETKADLRSLITGLVSSMKGQVPEPSIMGTSLPPAIIHCCEQSDKWGVGFVLSNGSIGTLSRHRAPEKLVIIPNTLEYYLSLKEPAKSPILPRDKTIYFYERDAHKRIPELPTPPVLIHIESSDNYQTQDPSNNSSHAFKLDTHTNDPFHNERCRLLSLWSKFASFMAPRITTEVKTGLNDPAYPEPHLVLFQNVGNVRAWWWSNNGSEFEFPDGTKLALSSDGTRVRFSYWPTETSTSATGRYNELPPSPSPDPDPEIQATSAGGPSKSTYRKRVTLRTFTLPLDIILAASETENEDIWMRLESNGFKRKLGFVRDLLYMWHRNGGVGECGREKLAYGGMNAVGGNSGSREDADDADGFAGDTSGKLRWTALKL